MNAKSKRLPSLSAKEHGHIMIGSVQQTTRKCDSLGDNVRDVKGVAVSVLLYACGKMQPRVKSKDSVPSMPD